MPLHGSAKAAAVPEMLYDCRKFCMSLNLFVFVNRPSFVAAKKSAYDVPHTPSNAVSD